MRKQQVWLASLVAAAALTGATSASANPLPFTWNPAGASPSLGGSAFTADTMHDSSFLRGVGQPDGSSLAHHIDVITGFSLNGSPVMPVGFGTAYGLYFDLTDISTFGAPPQVIHFTSGSMVLKADPGNQNGAVSATVDGIGFANTGPTGEADDIVLATGSVVVGIVQPGPGDKRAGRALRGHDHAGARSGWFLPVAGVGWIDLSRSILLPAVRLRHVNATRWHADHDVQRPSRHRAVGGARTGIARPARNGPSRPSDTPAIPPKAVKVAALGQGNE